MGTRKIIQYIFTHLLKGGRYRSEYFFQHIKLQVIIFTLVFLRQKQSSKVLTDLTIVFFHARKKTTQPQKKTTIFSVRLRQKLSFCEVSYCAQLLQLNTIFCQKYTNMRPIIIECCSSVVVP